MKLESMVVVFSLAVVPLAFAAQSSHTVRRTAEVGPPRLESVVPLSRLGTDQELVGLLAVQPQIPLGPADLLKGYENGMSAIAQRISAELAAIAEAVRLGHITPDQAEYLTQERYQLAIMQYQVLSTLHDSLAQEIAQASTRSKHSPRQAGSDTTLAVEPRFAIEEQSQ